MIIVADPKYYNVDQDPSFYLEADPDTDPTFQCDANPDPDPASHQSDEFMWPVVYRPSTAPF
jgi:hypothetical protein